MTGSEFTSAAPYGQACADCSRSKCKCMRRPSGGPCERCLRRGLECKRPSGARQRTASSKGLGPRTAQLEAKLDRLVTLLESPARSTSPGPAMTSQLLGTHQGNAEPLKSGLSPLQSQPLAQGDAGCGGFDPPVHAQTPELGQGPEHVSDLEAENCLAYFRSKLKYFPFIHIPDDTTAATFQRDRPFLWLCVLAVSTKSSARQIQLGSKIRRLIAEKLLVQHERSIELLLGMLAFQGWANYQMGPSQPFLGMDSHLVVGLVQDMGIEKAPRRHDEPSHPMACLRSHFAVQRLISMAERTMEERRAVLGAYLITSEVASFRAYCFNRQIDGLRWTPHLESYLQTLEEQRESPLDPLLTTLVRLKLLADEANKPLLTPPQPLDHLSLLHSFQAQSLQTRINQIKQGVRADTGHEDIIRLHVLSAELEVSEVGLYHCHTRRTVTPDTLRLNMLAKCLQTLRSWLDVFFGMETSSLASASFFIWCQMSHVITSLYRLTVIEEPDWDMALVRDTVDVMEVMDKLIERFSHVSAEAGLICDRPDGLDPYGPTLRSVRTIKSAWEATLRSNGGDVDLPSLLDVEGLDHFSTEFLEGMNGWMSDMFVSWDPTITTQDLSQDTA
ncbi:hypothetical protein B0T16DRAFT_139420 [Cercophora newfieldiana]|uniref:Zn(2)-C6 fungal-type domain-containing protein n=1 Tax=Cercophora newfieldiana TaxID=92897 RepID=A0AA40CTE9_9PEZI|nr:hypothetical protein B0T16DRAFT_139420 [Cercophora newfieldiana]